MTAVSYTHLPFSQQYNLNIGRGTEKNTFNASLSYRNNREEDKYTDSESFGLNLQNTTRLTSWLSLDLGTYLNYGDGTTQSYNPVSYTHLALSVVLACIVVFYLMGDSDLCRFFGKTYAIDSRRRYSSDTCGQ